jgi:drug/metabolite transporter (DMT)-like permease
MNRRKQAMGYLFVILSAVIFGCMPLMVKGIYADGVNSLSVVLLRNLLSAPVTVALARMQKGSLKIPAKALPEIASIGIVGCCLTPLLLFSSYFFMDSGTAMVLHFVYPAAVLVGGVLFFRERVTPGALISIAVCILGISQFYTPGTPLDWRGSALAIISGFGYAAYILMLSHFKYREISGFLLNAYIFSINSIVLFVVCFFTGMLTFPTTLSGWLCSLILALCVNLGAVSMFQMGTRIIGGQKAAILSTMEPTTSVFVGILVFREIITLRTAIGSVLVILASILIVLLDSREEKQA